MFWYEYIINFDREIYLFWNKEITGATILFFVNRYSTLFYMTYAFPWLPFSMRYEVSNSFDRYIASDLLRISYRCRHGGQSLMSPDNHRMA